MAGRLPWDARNRGQHSQYSQYPARRMFALKKLSRSGARVVGDLSVFGEFVDHTRKLGYTVEPDYAGWRERFRALVPGLP